MSLTYQTVLGSDGKPSAALIPWAEFVNLVEGQGHDLGDTERDELREALADSKANHRDTFVAADDV